MPTAFNEPAQLWERLSGHMEAFLQAWEQNPPAPVIADFLPHDHTLRGVAAVELIKIDLEQRHLTQQWWPLERYMELYPEILHEGEPPCDLIYEEFHTRKSRGEQPDPEEYFRRFRNSKPVLERLLNCYDANQTMSLAANRPTVQFSPGDMIDDFVLLTKLGKGAFASVFLARQQSMQRLVALKISADKGNEPQTLAQLDHPHIVRVYDQRRLPEKHVRLLYMQYAPGGTLLEVNGRVARTLPQDRSGRLLIETVNESLDAAGYPQPESSSHRNRQLAASWPETVCRMGIQLAQALDFAHRRGVLHRDVKPANVLLTAECTPKLADFNISFCSQLEGASPAAYFGGSLSYMSPEQLEACNPEHDRQPAALNGRADLFSLSALLWEMLYGVRPFREGNLSTHWSKMLTELVQRRRKEKPQPPYPTSDPLQIELTKVLLRGLSPNIEDRPTDGMAFARDLALCLQPKSRRLLELPSLGWRRLARAWPMLATILVVLFPNALAGFFNYTYNHSVIQNLGEQADHAFKLVTLALNGFYFSLGALLARLIVYPAAHAVCLSEVPGALSPELAIAVRLRAIRFGSISAFLGVLLWLTSGITFPLSIQWMYPEMPGYVYLHFLASMTICGLIAAAYPFFGFTILMTRVFYPALLRVAPGTDADEDCLLRLASRTTPYLLTAGIVPLASMLLVVLTSGEANHQVILALIVSGLAGLVFAYMLYQKIRQDITALLIAVRPLDAANTETESRSVL